MANCKNVFAQNNSRENWHSLCISNDFPFQKAVAKVNFFYKIVWFTNSDWKISPPLSTQSCKTIVLQIAASNRVIAILEIVSNSNVFCKKHFKRKLTFILMFPMNFLSKEQLVKVKMRVNHSRKLTDSLILIGKYPHTCKTIVYCKCFLNCTVSSNLLFLKL